MLECVWFGDLHNPETEKQFFKNVKNCRILKNNSKNNSFMKQVVLFKCYIMIDIQFDHV